MEKIVAIAASNESNTSTSFTPAVAASSGDLKSCNTCGGSFDTTAYRAHFRSEWHRFNLKLKMLDKPSIDEDDFLAMSVEELALIK